MLKGLAAKSIPIGKCMDARGFLDAELTDGVHRSSMAELASWTLETDKVLVF
jgi:sulfur relay (sulfurtransferase) complex TusBCD TusD component (DsrE family)